VSREIHESIEQVSQAIESLNRAFEKQVSELQRGQDSDRLNHWVKAARAMQDSGHLYLTWARHYAGLSEPSEEDDTYMGEDLANR
jgi:hypothetical protein